MGLGGRGSSNHDDDQSSDTAAAGYETILRHSRHLQVRASAHEVTNIRLQKVGFFLQTFVQKDTRLIIINNTHRHTQ